MSYVIWQRYRSPVLWVLGFVVVIWVALMLTAPSAPLSGPSPRPTPSGMTRPGCPLSAPNAAAGCLILTSP